MNKLCTTLGGLLIGALLSSASMATPTYLRSTVGAPWGVSTNEAAMDAVFGAGMWDDLRYETVAPGTLFTGATGFIFMEGGDNNADELEAFLSANSAAISAWVSVGGRLLVNAAPNEGDGMDFGFGVTLHPIYNTENGLVIPAGAHPIFAGPALPVGAAWTGSAFAHTNVSGAGLDPILIDSVNSDIFLGEMLIGSGIGLFGGMTTDNFHNPDPESHNLRINIIAYAANFNGVPEPGTLALLGLGLAGLGFGRRKIA